MTTWYEKRGRRYVPVAEHEMRGWDVWTEGTYLVSVKPGVRSTMRLVSPASGEVEAAIKIVKDGMLSAMLQMNQSAGEPMAKTEEDRERAKKAHAAYMEIMGDRGAWFKGVSMHDVIDAGLSVLREHMKKEQA